jgi:peroxiredoxin
MARGARTMKGVFRRPEPRGPAARLLALAVALLLCSARPTAAEGAPQAWLGVELEEGQGGVRIRHVLPNSPAARAGLIDGEEIVELDQVPVSQPATLRARLARGLPGARVKLRLVGPLGPRVVTALLEARPSANSLQRGLLEGQAAPDFRHPLLGGPERMQLSSLRGKVVVLDFFATWCVPCVASLPHLVALDRRLARRGVQVVGISTEPGETIAPFAREHGLSYALISDEDESISRRYQVFALPTVVVVDRAGLVKRVSVGDLEAVDQAVADALRTPAPGTVPIAPAPGP